MIGIKPGFWYTDTFVVVNSSTGTWVESHFRRGRANCACDVLNRHEECNGRPPVYEVIEVTQREMAAFLKTTPHH